VGFETEDKVRGVKIALQLAVIGGRVVNHVEVHASAEGRRLHLFGAATFFTSTSISGAECFVMNFLDDVVFAVGVENTVGELAVEKVERFREIVLNRVAVCGGNRARKTGIGNTSLRRPEALYSRLW